MNWEDIVICILIIIIIFLLFLRSKKEKFEVSLNGDGSKINTKEYYQELCKKTTENNDILKKYLEKNCREENKDELKNFRSNINNRNWCHLMQETEITSDINKDSWCNLANSQSSEILSGYVSKSLENVGEYEEIFNIRGNIDNKVSNEITPNI
jgi:hypothetical protein